MRRAISYRRAAKGESAAGGRAVLAHDERYLRRKVIRLEDGSELLLDLPQAVALEAGDRLITEDGSTVEIDAAAEPLYEVRGRDERHLTELAWHLGNRHLPAQIEAMRILILRDHVIRQMLEHLGAQIRETVGPFSPVRGAYQHAIGHDHDHHHLNEHGH